MRFALLVLAWSALALPASAGVAVGEPAPAFSLMGSDGRIHALADSVGQRAVVIAWFPKAFTPG